MIRFKIRTSLIIQLTWPARKMSWLNLYSQLVQSRRLGRIISITVSVGWPDQLKHVLPAILLGDGLVALSIRPRPTEQQHSLYPRPGWSLARTSALCYDTPIRYKRSVQNQSDHSSHNSQKLTDRKKQEKLSWTVISGMIDCGIGKGGCGGRSPHTLMTNKPIFRGHGPKSFSAYGPKNLNPALIL